MKHVTVGIFHDEALGRELGKKGTESDIVMFNRKTDTCIFTFMHPLGDKISAKTQIISSIDAAILCCTELTPEVGETILMLDAVGISKGIIVVPLYTDTTRLNSMVKGTSLESFVVVERDLPKIVEYLEQVPLQRDSVSPPLVVVDHSFSVKGVGEVILGLVRIGTIRKHDSLVLLPGGKPVMVRSIQMQDSDFDAAEAGSRVGLAVKGVTVDELKRGSVLCFPESAKTGTKFLLSFSKNRFYPEIKEGVFHVTVGMQTVPVMVSQVNNGSLTIESEKPIAYIPNDSFLLLDLNAKKLHLMGMGTIVTTQT
jgi:selenocysteine-specific translation elongation factor